MGLAKNLADLIQADNDTNVRIDDLELEMGDGTLGGKYVVKHTEQGYSNGPDYLINAKLEDDTNVGSEITTIRSDFLNADSKLQIGMKQIAPLEEKPINNIVVKFRHYETVTVHVKHSTYYQRDGEILSHTPSDVEFPDGYPTYPGRENKDIGETMSYHYLRIPFDVEMTLSPTTEEYSGLPVFGSETSYNSIHHADPGLVSGVTFTGYSCHEPSYYSQSVYHGPSKTLGDFQPTIFFDNNNWEMTNVEYEPDLDGVIFDNSAQAYINSDGSASYGNDDYYVDISGTQVHFYCRYGIISGTHDSVLGNVNIIDYISWDSETKELVINHDNTLIHGFKAGVDDHGVNHGAITDEGMLWKDRRAVMCFTIGGNHHGTVDNMLDGTTRWHININSIQRWLCDIPGNAFATPSNNWTDKLPYNKEIYTYQTNGSRLKYIDDGVYNPIKEFINQSLLPLDVVINYTDETSVNTQLPVFYVEWFYSWNQFIEVSYSYDYRNYNTIYTSAQFSEYELYKNDPFNYMMEEPNDYDLLLGQINRNYNSEFDRVTKKNNSYIGYLNNIFSDYTNNKIIGDENLLNTSNKVTLIGNNNVNYVDIFKDLDIVIANELSGLIIRDNKFAILDDGEIISLDDYFVLEREIITFHDVSRYSDYINLKNYKGDILYNVYAPCNLYINGNTITLGNNNISLEAITTYVFDYDEIGLKLINNNQNQYVRWGNITQSELVDIFNNTNSYPNAEEVYW